ncbi:ATP synthase E chain-domain-containing protein [Fomitopsis serialis]|uniref:ATP synthase E chain-domain-containing protein n=1 Tax=Fomitopsis serialis TaxID=139415 RepID=UPI0020073CB9|nr:ATP synthase E chain-domain-containing protein [Neoantrodia serialis]KAH9929734.1 ATP synthase E chain-domain-containing protein [Neoantrodia serialis]
MASSTVNVVRYTALLTGVFYGIAHRRTLQKAHDEEVKHHAVHEREHLIAQAKEAWKKKQEGSKVVHSLVAVITDPEDPQFDLEKLVAKWESES